MSSLDARAKTRAYFMRLNGSTLTDDENYFAALKIEKSIAYMNALSYAHVERKQELSKNISVAKRRRCLCGILGHCPNQ